MLPNTTVRRVVNVRLIIITFNTKVFRLVPESSSADFVSYDFLCADFASMTRLDYMTS